MAPHLHIDRDTVAVLISDIQDLETDEISAVLGYALQHYLERHGVDTAARKELNDHVAMLTDYYCRQAAAKQNPMQAALERYGQQPSREAVINAQKEKTL